ncbi:MAG: hypothetical protein ABSE43_16590 [Steroidobacteraceae bacterium]
MDPCPSARRRHSGRQDQGPPAVAFGGKPAGPMPGVAAAGGGPIICRSDTLAPEKILASHNTTPQRVGAPGGPRPIPGVVDRTRPVLAFPKVAHYTGEGSIDDAANFVAADPSNPALAPPVWLGAKYMVPGLQEVCTPEGATCTCKRAS